MIDEWMIVDGMGYMMVHDFKSTPDLLLDIEKLNQRGRSQKVNC